MPPDVQPHQGSVDRAPEGDCPGCDGIVEHTGRCFDRRLASRLSDENDRLLGAIEAALVNLDGVLDADLTKPERQCLEATIMVLRVATN